MKQGFLTLLLVITIWQIGLAAGYAPRNGDIVFQVSKSSDSKAIQLATRSPYSHVGVVLFQGRKPMVLEALQPVRLTPIQDWVGNGVDSQFVVKRLKKAERFLTRQVVAEMLAMADSLAGKSYDAQYLWSDSAFYCSELVWKLFDRVAGVEVGKLQKMSDFDLENPLVKAELTRRFGENVPLEEPVVAPVTIFNSELLTTVYESSGIKAK